MKVSTSELKSIIKEAINNVINNPLQELEGNVENVMAETSNQIEMLTNKLGLLKKIIPSVQAICEEISNKMPIARTAVSYGSRVEMILNQPIPYSDEIDSFIEEVNGNVDEMLREAVKVDYAFKNEGEDGMITGFYIDIELDYVQGWY